MYEMMRLGYKYYKMLQEMDSKDWDGVIFHCSDSKWGDLPTVKDWHTLPCYNEDKKFWKYMGKVYQNKSDLPESVRELSGRGWSDIGYSFLIEGEYPTYTSLKSGKKGNSDGKLRIGRPLNRFGAHCIGRNTVDIGVCLVGEEGTFTEAQFKTAVGFSIGCMMKYRMEVADNYGHCQFADKTCPEFDVDKEIKEKALSEILDFQLDHGLCVDGLVWRKTVQKCKEIFE